MIILQKKILFFIEDLFFIFKLILHEKTEINGKIGLAYLEKKDKINIKLTILAGIYLKVADVLKLIAVVLN